MNKHEKFLDFNGKKVFFLNEDGQWWIAIKPICEALVVDWHRQRKNLVVDPLLGSMVRKMNVEVQGRPTGGSARSDQTTQTPGEQAVGLQEREMLCLPEKWVYGWIFTLNPSKPTKEFLDYQRTCYGLLFEHFHGVITNRVEAIKERVLAMQEMEQVRKDLEKDPRYQRLMELKGVVLNSHKRLKEADRAIEHEQYTLFDLSNN